MANSPRFCKHCGNKLPDGAHFCGQCGAKITASTQPVINSPAYHPIPGEKQSQAASYSQPNSSPNTPAKKKSASTPIWLIAGIGLAGVFCIGIILLGLYFIPKIYANTQAEVPSEVVQPTDMQALPTEKATQITPSQAPTEAIIVEPTKAPTAQPTNTSIVLPTENPTEPASTETPIADEGGVFFDFSSGAQGWPVQNTADMVIDVQDGMYAFQLDAGLSPFSKAPVDFPTRRLKFDVIVLQGQEHDPPYSAFGISCYHATTGQDDAFLSIVFDAYNGRFRLFKLGSGADIPEWRDLAKWNPLGEVNQIEVVCEEYSVGLIVNGWEEEGSFFMEEQPVGGIMLQANAGPPTDPRPITVLFDNIRVYENP